MHWKIWRALEGGLGAAGLALALPGILLAEVSRRCGERKWMAKARAAKQIVDPTFVMSEEIE